jgi:hypothetical protein
MNNEAPLKRKGLKTTDEKDAATTRNQREPLDRRKLASTNQTVESGDDSSSAWQLYAQKFTTTSKICRPTQQLKRSIDTFPSNLCANVQCGRRMYYSAQPCGTLVHKFFGSQVSVEGTIRSSTSAKLACKGEGDAFWLKLQSCMKETYQTKN